MPPSPVYDFVLIGAGSAGCPVARELAMREAGSILVIEAGPSDRWPLARMPFGLVWTIGWRGRDWRYRSVPRENAAGRRIGIPRGKVIGRSGPLDATVRYRRRDADFDGRGVAGWTAADVTPVFEDGKRPMRLRWLDGARPRTEAPGGLPGRTDPTALPRPDGTGMGVFAVDPQDGRPWSATDAFPRPAPETGRVAPFKGTAVDRPGASVDRVDAVDFADGSSVRAGPAYHPVGTLRRGSGDGPGTERLALRGRDGPWVADASVMPKVTSANTNAPSMMIGACPGHFIALDAA